MAREETCAPPEATVFAVTVTVVPAVPRHPGLWRRRRASPRLSRRRMRAALASMVGLVAVGAALLGSGPPHAPARPGARAEIGAALGYPQRCVRLSISIGIPDYARANLGHGTGCARYRGYVNGSFYRVGGRWRLVVDEGQLFVPNRLLAPRAPVPLGCRSPAIASARALCTRARAH